MNQHCGKFQQLLRELFQFDCADLDFGIYRIINHKRDVTEKFIMDDLPKVIAEELSREALRNQEQIASKLEETAGEIKNTLGRKSLDSDGNLEERYHDTPLGKKYQNLKAKMSEGHGRKALEASIFNHLYTFFNRYYQDGDFISKRRYSKNQRYAIPYNGEEVYLYWANSDQYYIKTAEHFLDYTFKSLGITVHFKLQSAHVEQNNVKGDKRFFLPLVKYVTWNEGSSQIIIPFEYRPLTNQEKITYGRQKQQDSIITKSLIEIPKSLKDTKRALEALMGKHHENNNGEIVSILEHHLRQYTRRNTSDFFIHKNLKSFLSRELHFYLKNEVLNLDELEIVGESQTEGWFQILRVTKSVGYKIIDFLDQIERFQKALWEKRKFVTETQYCITIGNINESFYSDIIARDPQWTEWKELFHIDDDKALFNSGENKEERWAKRYDFLKSHPTLVLDTKHFDQSFVDRLLSSFNEIDEMVDGLLIHSENFQALNLLQEKYREKVKCIHIDPPYNTNSSGFLYKNNYQHSSWISMMENRLSISMNLMDQNSSCILCHIDDNEYENLFQLFGTLGIENKGTIIWDKRNPVSGTKKVATQHEYILCHSKGAIRLQNKKENAPTILDKAKSIIKKHKRQVTTKAKEEFRKWVNCQRSFATGEKLYCHLDDDGRVYQPVHMGAPEQRTHEKFFKPLIHPITKKPCPVPSSGWSGTPEFMQKLVDDNLIAFGIDETTQPRRKYFLDQNVIGELSTMIYDGTKGKKETDNLGLVFPYCHPTSIYKKLIFSVPFDSGYVIDYFAGSGTSGHAVINLNREDGGQRKFILVEMGECFNTVLLPRIKKIVFTPEWKDGRPRRMVTAKETKGSPRIIKYIHLESYEDALNNIEFDNSSSQRVMEFEDYLLQYMLKWETQASQTLLNVEKLVQPFCYKLHIHADGHTHEKIADIPETFNYLLGMHVQTRQVHDDEGRRYLVYRGRMENRQVVVIWRETEDWGKPELERDKEFVVGNKLTEDADDIFVNGDSFIPSAKALEPIFKARMFALAET